MNDWIIGEDPLKAGYYLATWIRVGVPIVSELWFDPGANPKWWVNRRYLRECHGAIKQGVLAWMPMPVPFNPETENEREMEIDRTVS